MTRFWITLEQGVRLVMRAIEEMEGGEVFVPKIPSMRVMDLADAVAPGCTRRVVGIRAGEKLHEVLLSEDESRHAVELKDSFVILPEYPAWTVKKWPKPNTKEGYRYASDTNADWLTVEQLKNML
jgi:FlaA1/EpsC-like NDP-sugar epimerase